MEVNRCYIGQYTYLRSNLVIYSGLHLHSRSLLLSHSLPYYSIPIYWLNHLPLCTYLNAPSIAVMKSNNIIIYKKHKSGKTLVYKTYK